MPHAIGDCALLADGRTAALVAADGEVVWLCWPRIDSEACLLGLLDAGRGGTFSVRPLGEPRVESRGYAAGLALRTVWRCGRGRLVVEEALAVEGPLTLLRILRAEGATAEVEVRFRPAFAFATEDPSLTVSGRRAVAAGGGLRLIVEAPGRWRIDGGVAVCAISVDPGRPAAVVLGEAAGTLGGAGAAARMAATLGHWRAVEAATARCGHLEALVARSLGTTPANRLLVRSAAVLLGLRQRGGGIVAAPTTSLPQGEGGGRTWDYRYAWMRDTAMAAQALLRLGHAGEAHSLAAFCGEVVLDHDELPSLVRVDGSSPPPERALSHLAGHGDATPVRVGNAAAQLVQADIAGELLELAWDLHAAGALPDALRQAVPRLAGLAATGVEHPDHGIWEVRGRPRRYTHSAVLAWSGLRRAAHIAAAGAVTGDAAAWETAAARLRRRVMARCRPAAGLELHARGGGPDAALSQAVLLGLPPPGSACARATLSAIEARLVRGRGVDRYLGQPDGLPGSCAPFVFPAFWLAAAQERCGLDPAARFAAAAAAAGPLDLFGEVVDPLTGAPLGNYPQVQSHAAFALAALEVRASEAGRR